MIENNSELIRFNHNSVSLCNLLQNIANETWERIGFARTRKGLKIFETTITQNILYEFHKYCDQNPHTPIRMFEAINEPLNGNDIELIIQTSGGYVIAPLQAKIIYKTDNYPAMDHGNQINDLITYAKNVGGVPLYLLYNHYLDTFTHNGNLCGIKFSKEQYGCSLVSAYYLLNKFAFNRFDKSGNPKWTIPNFIELHPDIAVPWYVLGCCRFSKANTDSTVNLINNTKVHSVSLKHEIHTYQYEDLNLEQNWKPLNTTRLNLENDLSKENNSQYLPKYRIILSLNEE